MIFLKMSIDRFKFLIDLLPNNNLVKKFLKLSSIGANTNLANNEP